MFHRLQAYKHLAPLRLLICGGDGSVGWVLKEIDKLHMKVSQIYTILLEGPFMKIYSEMFFEKAGIHSFLLYIIQHFNLTKKYDINNAQSNLRPMLK